MWISCQCGYFLLFYLRHNHISAAKKCVQHTCELFTGIIKLLISAPRITKTNGAIFTKFTYFMFYIRIHDLTYIPNFIEIGLVVHKICTPLMFLVFSSSWHGIKNTFKVHKTTFSCYT